jgi:hypothetical protein
MQLRGCLGIAIALSGVWLLGATVYERWQETDLRTGAGWDQATAILACLNKNTERQTRGEPEQRCGTNRELSRALQSRHPAPPAYHATVAAAIWLAIVWVVGYAVLSTVWWFQDWR